MLVGDCPKCSMRLAKMEAMEEKIAYLERELGVRRSDAEIAALMVRLGTTRAQSIIMLALYVAGGKPISTDQLSDILPRNGDGGTVKVHIFKLREILGEDVITTSYGVGYALTPKGLSMVMGALFPPETQASREP